MAIDFPNSPNVGMIYSVGNKSWSWTGTYWEVQGDPTSTFSASDSEPLNPSEGDIWYRSDTAQTLIRYDSTWVEIGHSANITNQPFQDADTDTKIQLEEGPDDDTIRFDTAGVERMTIGPTGTVSVAGDLSAGTVSVTGDLSVTGTISGVEDPYPIVFMMMGA